MTLVLDVRAELGALQLHVRLPPLAGVTVVVGPNGAGKSTLLKTVLGVNCPVEGRIELEGKTLFCADRGVDVATEDRRLGYVPQSHALFSHMLVWQNVGFGIRERNRKKRRARVMEMLAELGIAHLAEREPESLSGGESQRVALARALAIGPRALLLDEPTAALDATARRKVRLFLAARLEAIAVPTIVVSHDAAEVEALGGQVVVLEEGAVVQQGSVAQLREQPATSFVREFFAGQQPSSADDA